MIKAALAEGNVVHFWCPACDDAHMIRFGGDGWTWNGDLESPSFTPSVKVTGVQWERSYPFFKPRHHVEPGEPICCHSWVTAGRIRFYDDSTHDLAGQTVDLPEWPYGDELEDPEVPAPPKGSIMTNIQGTVVGVNLDPASGNTVANVSLTGSSDEPSIVGGQLVIVLNSDAESAGLKYGSSVTLSVSPADAAPAAPVEPQPAPAGEPAPAAIVPESNPAPVEQPPAADAAPAPSETEAVAALPQPYAGADASQTPTSEPAPVEQAPAGESQTPTPGAAY